MASAVAHARRGPLNALHHAAIKGSTERTVAHLAAGLIDIDEGDPIGWTPLTTATHHGHSRVVKVLLDKGANVSLADGRGCTALHVSAEHGHLAIVKMLVEAGTELDSLATTGHTPLIMAAGYGRLGVVRFLITAGANLNRRTDTGATALCFASKRGHLEVVRELLRSRADPLLGEKFPDDTRYLPLEFVALLGLVEVVRELILQVGIEGCGGARIGWKALMYAVKKQHVGVMAVLFDAGVVGIGPQCLYVACKLGLEASMKYLLRRQQTTGGERGRGDFADAVVSSDRATPLVVAICSGHSRSPRIVRLLIDAGADTTSAVRITDLDTAGKKELSNETPLALTDRYLREKEVDGKAATEEQLHTLEAIRRMLLRVEAVRAVSWLWLADAPRPSHAAHDTQKMQAATTNGTALRTMLPMMRRRATRPGMVWRTLFRWVMSFSLG